MREILFRGKRKYSGRWIYGGVDTDWGLEPKNRDRFWINQAYYGESSVIPETVGQYSGKKDRNGVKMFEGDIVRSWFAGEKYYEVIFRDGAFGLRWVHNGYERFSAFTSFVDRVEFEVIGNIHDNPELLKGGAE